MQPLMTIDRQVVCFFMCSHENANLNFVVFVSSQKGREWIAWLYSARQCRVEGWLNVELRIDAGDVRLVNLRQITGSTGRLRVGVRIANAQRHWFIAIVNTHRALVRRGDCFRTWRRNSTRTNETVLHEERQSYFVDDWWIDDSLRIGNRLAVRTDAGAGLVSQLEISKLKHELAVTVRRCCLNDVCLPARRAAICAGPHRDAGFRILPDRTLRLDHQTGIETCLLVRRWSKVIVCEHGPERTIHAVVVECVVGKPALHGSLCAERAEVRVCFRLGTSERAVTYVT